MTVHALALEDAVTGEVHRVVPRRLLVAGFTGREQREVQRHVEELRAFGAAVPDSTPVLFELDPTLVTTGDTIAVAGPFTSGEVEPVVVVSGSTRLLTVGSDHTDRDLERESLARSKQACPKVVSPGCVRIDRIADWDALELASWVDDEATAYQRGSLRALLALDDLLRRLAPQGAALGDGDVLFMGTVPVTGGGLRASDRFRGTLRDPSGGWDLTVDYRITHDPTGPHA